MPKKSCAEAATIRQVEVASVSKLCQPCLNFSLTMTWLDMPLSTLQDVAVRWSAERARPHTYLGPLHTPSASAENRHITNRSVRKFGPLECRWNRMGWLQHLDSPARHTQATFICHYRNSMVTIYDGPKQRASTCVTAENVALTLTTVNRLMPPTKALLSARPPWRIAMSLPLPLHGSGAIRLANTRDGDQPEEFDAWVRQRSRP